MEKEDFRRGLREATHTALSFTRGFVRENLPETVRYRISLNSSYDGNPLEKDEVVFPEDSDFAKSAAVTGCTEGEFLNTLWRDGRVPEWIDLSIIAEDGKNSVLKALSCGRYTASEELLYHQQEGYPPFHVCSPPLPVGYEDGDKFSIYHNAECWSEEDLLRLPQAPDAPWSLQLYGPAFGDNTLAKLPVFPALEVLELKHIAINGEGLAALGKQKKLRVLRICLAPGQVFSLEPLPEMKGLEVLDLVGLPGATQAFERLGKQCPRLNWLTVESKNWSPANWPALRGLRSLTLRLGNPAPEIIGKSFRKLDSLSLHGDWVTSDYAATALANCPMLTSAQLYNSSVDDSLLAAVARHPRLEHVSVVDTKVTREAIARLLVHRPGLRIYPSQPTPANDEG